MNKSLLPPKLEGSIRSKIQNDLKSRKTPDDVIAAMFSYLKTEEIPLDVKRIHTAMHQIRQNFPNELEKFRFSRGDMYPFSRLLEKTLFRLQNSSLISTVNPDFKVCIVSKESKKYIRDNVLPCFSPEEKERLERMARDFEQLVGSP